MTQRSVPPTITDRQAFDALAQAFGHLAIKHQDLCRRVRAAGIDPDEEESDG